MTTPWSTLQRARDTAFVTLDPAPGPYYCWAIDAQFSYGHIQNVKRETLQACFEGFMSQVTFIVDFCRGYPDKPLERKGISYKANADYYGDVLSWLNESTIDVASIEGAQSNLDLSVLPTIGKKTVMLGVLDVGSNEVESVEAIVK